MSILLSASCAPWGFWKEGEEVGFESGELIAVNGIRDLQGLYYLSSEDLRIPTQPLLIAWFCFKVFSQNLINLLKMKKKMKKGGFFGLKKIIEPIEA